MRFVGSTVRVGALLASVAYGDILVVPNAQTTVAGNTPFKIGGNPTHIQEVLGSGQFPGPVLIKSLRLRAFPGSGPISLGTAAVKVTLSTTQAYPNTVNNHALPNLVFSANVGPDATVVYNNVLTQSSTGCSPPGPCALDLIVPFSVP